MPPSFSFSARSVVESTEVSNSIASAAKTYPRIIELFDGWKWRLAREAGQVGVSVQGTNPPKFLLKTPPMDLIGLPTLLMIYSFDDDHVYIDHLKIYPPSEPKEN